MDDEPRQQYQPVSSASKSPEPIESAPTPSPTAATPPGPLLEPHHAKHGLLVVLVVFAALAIVVVGVVLALQTMTKQSSARIRVGVMMPFSGGSSSMGYGAMKGVQLAKKQLGADNIDIIQVDSKCEAKAADKAIKELIAKNVVAIIGEGCSSATVAVLPEANSAKIPLISPSASTATLTMPGDYFFRVVPPDTFQGAFIAQAMYERGIRTVATLYTTEAYGSGMNSVFREKFQALGGEVVATVAVEPGAVKLGEYMETLKAAAPEAMFIAPNSVLPAAAAMRLARESGIKATFFGPDIMYDNTVISSDAAAAEGLIISSFPTGTKAFQQALANEYGKSEQLYAAAQAYDIIHILHMAAQRGATTSEQIKNMLPQITLEDGVSGFRQFDVNGEVSDGNYRYDLFQVKSGAFTLIEQ